MRLKLQFCRTATALLVAATIPVIASAQETQEKKPELQNVILTGPEREVVKVIQVKHNFELVTQLIEGYPKELIRQTRSIPASGLITVSGVPVAIGWLESAIEKYDKPTRNLELVFQLVEASNDEKPSDVPEQLKTVIDELKLSLIYKSYHVLQPVILRVRDGSGAGNQGALAGPELAPAGATGIAAHGSYEIAIENVSVRGEDTERVASLKDLIVQFRGPQWFNSQGQTFGLSGGGQINTSIDVPLDATVVVGKANTGSEGQALFVILKARVVS